MAKKKSTKKAKAKKAAKKADKAQLPAVQKLPSDITDLIPADKVVIMTSPDQAENAQKAVRAWCDLRLNEVEAELKDIQENLDIAKKNKWRTVNLKRLHTTASRRVDYYVKVARALEMGYVLVPNFPVDVFAVRVRGDYEPGFDTAVGYVPSVKADKLPEGEGEYVDHEMKRKGSHKEEYETSGGHKRETVVSHFQGHAAVSPPATLAKPMLLGALSKALQRKIFDEIGVLPERKGKDPILVGRILDPRDPYNNRHITFLLAWWLDLETM